MFGPPKKFGVAPPMLNPATTAAFYSCRARKCTTVAFGFSRLEHG